MEDGRVKRSPMKRGKPMARGGSEMKRTPMKRGKGLRSRPKAPLDVAALRAMAEFKEAVRGLVCVVCGRTQREAYEATGYGHEAHHGVRRQVLRRRRLPEWDPRLAVCLCAEPCHRQVTSTKRRLTRPELPAGLLEFVREHGLEVELERELA